VLDHTDDPVEFYKIIPATKQAWRLNMLGQLRGTVDYMISMLNGKITTMSSPPKDLAPLSLFTTTSNQH